MAWEWVGPLGTTVVGVAGIVATYLSGRRQVSTARQVAQDQAMAALAAQREERHQKRIELAYPRLLEAVAKADEWLEKAEMVMLGHRKPEKLPERPDVVELIEKAAVATVWSPRVEQLTRQWEHAYREIRWWHVRPLKVSPLAPPPTKPLVRADVVAGRATEDEYKYDAFRRGRYKVKRAESNIRQQIWRELRSEDSGFLKEAQL